uniref:hypothetical protein n=1 Tax=Rhodococcus qingshengii TaxID=334542 RepID=UPI001C4E2C04|nr:hypothetical protein [Rhodococcus qingshengii]
MTRIDRLPEEYLFTRITDLDREFQELRTSVQWLGSSSVRSYPIFTTSTYDIVVSSVGTGNRIIELTFTPADRKTDRMGMVYSMDYTKVISNDSVGEFVEWLKPVNGIQKIRLYLNGSDFSPTVTASYKFYLTANGAGSFTASLV